MTIKEEMERVADEQQKRKEEYAQSINDSPCAVCGKNDFVQKFRNVVGEIEGSVHGNFSLFGGFISGSIDGTTRTLPVLSCRDCENEREIKTWDYVYGSEVFWDFMHNFYFGIDDNDDEQIKKIDPFFLERPLETRQYMLDNPNHEYDFYNEMPYWTTEAWARAGFKINKVIKKGFIWDKEVYPDWGELK